MALETELNPSVPFLARVAVADDRLPPALNAVVPPSAWQGQQVYEAQALACVPTAGHRLRVQSRKMHLVPFADALDGRVWLSRPLQLRTDVPAATAFARAGISVMNFHISPTQPGYVASDVTEFLTDEDPGTFCTIDPRNLEFARYSGTPPGKRGDPVWLAANLNAPHAVTRIVYRHGAAAKDGGWFDTSAGKPRLQVSRGAVPMMAADGFNPDFAAAAWEDVATLDAYPSTDASTPPPLTPGQAFEIRLPGPLVIYAIRLVGNPGGDYASCAELAAYS
jgi:hypothetical protein